MAEPFRWALATGCRWLCLEQVEEALPIWEDYAGHLTARGWTVDVDVLNARDYGVPQDRRRAILIGHRTAPVNVPLPTVTAPDHVPASTILGPGRVGFARLNDRDDGHGKYRARDMRSTDLPAFTVTEKIRSWKLMPEVGQPRAVTTAEAGQLQSFPADYVWTGSPSKQFLQIANAVPPALAAAVTAVVLDADGGL